MDQDAKIADLERRLTALERRVTSMSLATPEGMLEHLADDPKLGSFVRKISGQPDVSA